MTGSAPFKLGFLTHVHGAGRPAGAVYRDLVETFVAAEELGFDGGWIAAVRHTVANGTGAGR